MTVAAPNQVITQIETMISFLRPYVDCGMSLPHAITEALYEHLREIKDRLEDE